jgi:protein-tyrosine phosphatase
LRTLWDVIVDAGGLPVQGGGSIRTGHLFRVSGGLVVPDDLASFERLGLKALVDLRGTKESRTLLEDWAGGAGVRYVWLPIEAAGTSDLARAVSRATDAGEAGDALAELYVVILDRHGEQLARAIDVVAEGTPAAFGCAAGKDRTGLTAALIQLLVGAHEEDVVRSYAESPPSVDRLRALVADYFGPDEEEPPHLDVLLSAEQPTLRRALRHVDERYGGVESYVLAKGLAPEAVERLRAALVTDVVPQSRAS